MRAHRVRGVVSKSLLCVSQLPLPAPAGCQAPIPAGDNESAVLLPQTVLWELILQYLQSKQRREERGDILIKNFAW